MCVTQNRPCCNVVQPEIKVHDRSTATHPNAMSLTALDETHHLDGDGDDDLIMIIKTIMNG